MHESADKGLRHSYAAPVQRLLGVGESIGVDPAKWPDYADEYGLGREHAAELIRLACDEALMGAPSDRAEVWAPVHAWRALGQLKIDEAVPPLLALLKTAED